MLPLIRALKRDRPLVPIYLSTGTVAGRKAAEGELASLVAGIFYSPLDYVLCVRRTLRTIRPALLIVMETEIWPNLYAETKRAGAAVAIVNGRISNRTWPRYRAWKRFVSPVLGFADVIFVQSSTDYERYSELGASISKLRLEANLKYDARIAARDPSRVGTFGAEQIWIAASTVGPNERGSLSRHAVDEDDIVIETFQQLAREFPRLLLILAPRQPARFDVAVGKLERAGVPFLRWTSTQVNRFSKLELPGVLLLDTIGELSRTYSQADVVFVGGSLAPRGGHNIVEPAAAGVPIVIGPHMQNFEAIARDFLEARAVVQIEEPKALLPAIRNLLPDRNASQELGERARGVVETRQGVSERLAKELVPLSQRAYIRPPRGVLTRGLLKMLALLWCNGGVLRRRRYKREADSQAPLPVPVVSIGGITVGGSGKTPFTVYLAEQLRARGYQPAILTRGYRRRSPAKTLVFGPGMKVPVALTGDEPQIFLRAGIAPVGIGTNRCETAKVLLPRFPSADVLLLDDGFQHVRLNRDLDIVLIDGLDPFGQGDVVPLGRLREPLSSLNRAGLFVVTRAEDDYRYESICRSLREYNPTAPVFRTRLISRHWRDYRARSSIPTLSARRVAAFCGLGNPENFWRTLESLGLEVVFRWAFGDHHVYQPVELQRIAHQARASGAEILVTTEKDRINCPNHLETAIAPFDLAWLQIELRLENEAEFFMLLEQALERRAVA